MFDFQDSITQIRNWKLWDEEHPCIFDLFCFSYIDIGFFVEKDVLVACWEIVCVCVYMRLCVIHALGVWLLIPWPKNIGFEEKKHPSFLYIIFKTTSYHILGVQKRSKFLAKKMRNIEIIVRFFSFFCFGINTLGIHNFCFQVVLDEPPRKIAIIEIKCKKQKQFKTEVQIYLRCENKIK